MITPRLYVNRLILNYRYQYIHTRLTLRGGVQYVALMILAIPNGLLSHFIYFASMSFLGWIIETVYRSLHERRFVNAGFLTGPFVPIYGFGALAITLLGRAVTSLSPVAAWAAMLSAPTLLEYVTSWLLERLFGMALWDYRDRKFNVHGRVCLEFSIYWAALAPVLVYGINPFVFSWIAAPGPFIEHYAAGFLSCWLAIDTWRSVQSVFDYKAALAEIRALVAQGRSFLPSLDSGERGRVPAELRRLLKPISAFPALARELRPHLAAFPDWIRERIEARMRRRR